MRLTNNHGEIVACGDNCKYDYEHCHDNNCPSLNECYDKLAEYEKLEEEHKLLKLPVSINSIVYEVSYFSAGRCSYKNIDFAEDICMGCEYMDKCDSQRHYMSISVCATLWNLGYWLDQNLFGTKVFVEECDCQAKCDELNKQERTVGRKIESI